MRIGFFSPTINRIGGGEWVTLNMIYALRAKKHKVVVYSADKIDPVHIQKFFGHPLHYDNEVSFWPNIFDPYNLESIYPNLFKSLLFSLKCNLLIDTFSNGLLPWTDAVYFQGPPSISWLPKGVKRARYFLLLPYKALLRHTNRHVRHKEKVLMACSKWSAKIIEEATRLNVKVLYPPVSDFFKYAKNQPKRNIVTTVARISRGKKLEIIPKVAKLVSNEISFIIIGNCKYTNQLDALNYLQESIRKSGVQKKVKILLNISREKQRNILRSSKVYLHPPLFEAFGVSIVEAMSAGCIPIVPDYGGPREFVPKPYRYTSIEEAASIIENSIANWSPHKTKEFIDIANRFSQTRFCDKFLKLMKL